MALIKFGGGVTAMSGSIAGNTFARNRSGNYVRCRTKPVNPNSGRQTEARSRIQQLVELWSSVLMSATNRSKWATYASAITMKNKLGEATYLSGFNHFIRSNATRIAAGGTPVLPGPAELTLPPADPTIASSGDAGTQLLTIAFDNSLTWASEVGGYLLIEMGEPQNKSRNFFGGPYRTAGAIAGAETPPTSPKTISAPFALVDGQKVWCRARVIQADARATNMFYAPAFEVGGLLPLYYVAGATDPLLNCDHPLGGAFNGKAYYRRADLASFLWWDGTSAWIISELLGVTGDDYFKRINVSPVGAYTNMGDATGTVTIGAGSCPP